MADASDEMQKTVRHVRFAATEEKENQGSDPKPPENVGKAGAQVKQLPTRRLDEPEQLIPRRIVLHDAKTHLAAATFLLIFLLLVALRLDDGGGVKEQAEVDAARGRTHEPLGRAGAVRDRFKNKIEDSFSSAPRRAEECSFYVASSSLPGSQSFGLYAGTAIQEGAVVLNISSVAYLVADQGAPLVVSHYGFLLGHHHLLQNLRGGPLWSYSSEGDLGAGSVLKASRDIKEGEELFLGIDEHPASIVVNRLFSYPVKYDFDLAQEIIADELNYLRPFRGRAVKAKPDDGAFRLIRKTIEKVNQHAARMLPSSTQELTTLDFQDIPLALGVMRNKSMEWLRRFGRCLDDTEERISSEGSVTLFAKRQFSFGDVVLPVPLYVTSSGDGCSSSENEECSILQQNFYRLCFGHNETSLILCPLSSAGVASTSYDPNVVFRWSSWNSQNKESHKVSVDRVIQSYSKGLSWDLVAVREIEPGEQIKVRVGTGSTFFGGYIPKELLPVGWRNIN